jgi:phytoene synthase
MFEIYSFCRAVDDIADRADSSETRLLELKQWRDAITSIFEGTPPSDLIALATAIRAFDLRRNDFLAIIDGMEMDVLTDIRCPSLATLDRYCDCVASAVGRLSVRVFGMKQEPGLDLAHHLGRALQLTNILRDLDDDAAVGRLYLPKEDLHAAGIFTTDPQGALAKPSIGIACSQVVARAEDHFRAAFEIMATTDRRTARAPRVMGAAYRLILKHLVARGWESPRMPVKLRKRQLLWILLRYGF